jgi:hypothetical protein
MEHSGNTEIRIQQALTAIRTSMQPFSIEFFRVDGSGRTRKENVCLGVPPKPRTAKPSAEGAGSPSKVWNHQINQSHNLLLFDMNAMRPFEVKICLLMAFNDYKIRWHVAKK